MSAPAKPRPGLLANRDFTRFWFGETVSLFGVRITALALPLTAVLALDANPGHLGVLWFLTYLPYLFAMPFGVLVDRLAKRPLMMAANLLRGVLIGLVPVLAALDMLTMGGLYAITLGIAFGTVLFEVCWQSYVPVLVPKEDLVAANGRVTASWSAAESAGPGLGGLLVQALTAPFALVANAFSYLVSVWTLWRIRVPEPRPAPSGRKVGREMRDGFAFVVRQPLLRAIVMSGAVYNFFYVFLEALFVIYAVEVLGFGAGLIGLVLSIGAIGGVLGAALAARLVRRFPFGRVYIVADLVGVCGPLLIPLVTGPTVLAVIGVTTGFLVMRAGSAVANTASISLRQAVTPSDMLGRMNAGMRTLMWSPQTLGALAGGYLGTVVGIRAGLFVAGVGCLLSALPLLLSRIPALRELPSVPVVRPARESVPT
jgi:MFS family permease